jgi:stage II sporulation protein D
MQTYRNKIIIKNDVVHRFPVTHNLTAINILPIEEYLYGVVSSEIGMAKEVEFEAVKAQAVCARSYTMSLLGKRKDFDLYGSYLYDQEYKGMEREYKLAIEAVGKTRGEVMQYQNEDVLAQYHACCGGRTTYGRYPYLQPIIDAPRHSHRKKPFCKDSPYFEWTVKVQRDSFDATILRVAGITYKFKLNPKLEINKITKRVDYLTLKADKEYKLAGETIRKVFNLKSTFFTITTKSDSVEINGFGWGHGIGLCQYGALEMARQKISYKNILKHYYTGIKIVKVY